MKKISLLLTILLVGSCCALSNFVRVNTNIPLRTTVVTVANNATVDLDLFFDGIHKSKIKPGIVMSFHYWVGGGMYSSSSQVSVLLLDAIHNRSWADVFSFTSYYKCSYVLIAREENGQLRVERR